MREEEEEEALARDPILSFRRGNAGHVDAIAPLGHLFAASNVKIRIGRGVESFGVNRDSKKG